jgi:hypothetical protein
VRQPAYPNASTHSLQLEVCAPVCLQFQHSVSWFLYTACPLPPRLSLPPGCSTSRRQAADWWKSCGLAWYVHGCSRMRRELDVQVRDFHLQTTNRSTRQETMPGAHSYLPPQAGQRPRRTSPCCCEVQSVHVQAIAFPARQLCAYPIWCAFWQAVPERSVVLPGCRLLSPPAEHMPRAESNKANCCHCSLFLRLQMPLPTAGGLL